MKKILQVSGIVFLLLVILAGYWVIANKDDIKNFRPMASGAHAKFMCSCMFVEGRTEEQCVIWSRLSIPASRYDIDRKKKTVSSTALGLTSTARYRGERYGCTLE